MSIEQFDMGWLRQVCGWKSFQVWQVRMLQDVLIARLKAAIAGRTE